MVEAAATPLGREEARIRWLHEFEEGGVVAYRTGRQARRLVAEWPGVARLTCGPSGGRSELTPLGGKSVRSLRKLGGVVQALLADLRGGIGIHASAVAFRTGAVLLLGDSGAGKSTAAAQLCLRRRASLLADDAAALHEVCGKVHVMPSEDRHYLTTHASRALGIPHRGIRWGRDKRGVAATRVASRPYPLQLVACLRFDDSKVGPTCTKLSGADAVLRVIGAMFRFDMGDRRQELDRVMRLYQQVPFVEIVRPRRSPGVVPHVLRALAEASS
jgi:hypothetical protein